jgi:hypothetical protein
MSGLVFESVFFPSQQAVILVISCPSNPRENYLVRDRNADMEKFSTDPYQTDCPLAHDLINKLAIIVGNCDLLVERIPETSPLWNRMLLVRDLAKAVGEQLGQLQCDLARVRTIHEHKTSITRGSEN